MQNCTQNAENQEAGTIRRCSAQVIREVKGRTPKPTVIRPEQHAGRQAQGQVLKVFKAVMFCWGSRIAYAECHRQRQNNRESAAVYKAEKCVTRAGTSHLQVHLPPALRF